MPSEGQRLLPRWAPLAFFVGCAALALTLYGPALRGDFVSDDLNYVTQNPTIAPLDFARFLDILDPWGSAARYIANYAPVQMSIVALQVATLGEAPLGFHLLNVLMHAAASTLLALLALRAGLAPVAAGAVGLLFLVHPANVEAVAWISQLKTNGALAASLAALLLFRRHPAAGFVAFLLALGFKATALAALPTAAAQLTLEWRRSASAEPSASRAALGRAWAGLALWAIAGLAYAALQLGSFSAANARIAPLHSEWIPWAANLIALVGRYVGMGVGWGLSTFQQPTPIAGVVDPWVGLGALAVAGIAWRAWTSWQRASPEFAGWVFAVAGWAPSSQLFPFTYPIADRYLYFVLAGALPAIALALTKTPRFRERSLTAARIALGLVLFAAIALGARAHERVRVWRAPAFVLADSVAHYPEGLTARVLRARKAASLGRIEETERELRAAIARGFDGLSQLLQDPAFAPVLDAAPIQAIVHELARDWIAHFEAEAHPTQQSLQSLAHAYFVIGERDRALATLERALERGGRSTTCCGLGSENSSGPAAERSGRQGRTRSRRA